jgi:Uma2 family endonuclease
MSAQPDRRLFNVKEYYQMAQAGILKPEDRVELIDGEIIKMSPIGTAHAACVERTADALRVARLPKTMVRTQNPVRLGDSSEPVPDISLLRRRADYYSADHQRQMMYC